MKRKWKQYLAPSQIGLVVVYLLLALCALTTLLPFVWMLSSSLKLSKDVFAYPIQWWPQVMHWENYKLIWQEITLLLYFKNSAVLSVVSTVFCLLTSSFAAYAFAKIPFKGRETLFLAYVGTIAIPWQVYMIPQYIMMSRLHLIDTHISLILMYSFAAFGVFMMRQFYQGIPNDLCESARIDGLNEYGIYARIMLPLSKPALATLTIFTFVMVWNDFMGPLIYINSNENKTIQLGLRLFISQYSADYNLIMAASLVSLVPILVLFVFLQRFFVEGIATSGLKG